MRFLSLFSGIEAASAAWLTLGWTCVGVSEIESYCCTLLRQRHPNVPNLGDITAITEQQIAALGRIDIMVFGSPCQDLSVAGKRKGFTDVNGDTTRSGLFFAAMRIVGWARKHCGLRFALWENVPGAFSSNAGRDFAAVVGLLGGLETGVPPKGWGTEGCAVGTEGMVEWSTLDAQHFGVPQRRRRVFALADFGDWAGRPPILLEPEGLRGDSPPRREPGEEVAGSITGSLGRRGGTPDCGSTPGLLRPVLTCVSNAEGAAPPVFLTCSNLAKTVNNQTPLLAFDSRQDCVSSTEVFGALGSSSPQAQAVCITGSITHALKAEGFDASEDGTGRGQPIVPVFAIQAGALRENPLSGQDGVGVQPHIAYTLEARAEVQAVCFAENSRGEVRLEGGDGSRTGALSTGGGKPGQGYPVIAFSAGERQVRRLTPLECERLQGFTDRYTLVEVRKKPAADGPRYKALGNSMAVPVMAWIGRQIDWAMLFDLGEQQDETDIGIPASDDCADLFA